MTATALSGPAEPTASQPDPPRRGPWRRLRLPGLVVPALLLLGLVAAGAGGALPGRGGLEPVATGRAAAFSYAGEYTAGPQAMAGDLKLKKGDSLVAGFSLTAPGNSAALTAGAFDLTWVFPYTCTVGSHTGTITLTAPDQSFSISDSKWYASGDQSSPATRQSNVATVADQCPGGELRLQKGGTFATTVLGSRPVKINIRWHYLGLRYDSKGVGKYTSGSWSGTGTCELDLDDKYPVDDEEACDD